MGTIKKEKIESIEVRIRESGGRATEIRKILEVKQKTGKHKTMVDAAAAVILEYGELTGKTQ